MTPNTMVQAMSDKRQQYEEAKRVLAEICTLYPLAFRARWRHSSYEQANTGTWL
jgi:hypothetical protein